MANKENKEIKDHIIKELRNMPSTATWLREISSHLVGRTITRVRYLSEDEATDMDWPERSIILTLDNGVELMPSSDDEGNNAGALFTTLDDLPVIPVMR